MSADKYRPHLLVIPEDDANREIVNGFRNHLLVNSRQIQVESAAGGWVKALEIFEEEHVRFMQIYPTRHVLILIDLDGRVERIETAKRRLPAHLNDRVFIMGSLETPERVCAVLKMSKESIGEALANECLGRVNGIWTNGLLAHNGAELRRMQTICSEILKD